MKGFLLVISLFILTAESFGQAKFFKTYANNGYDFGQGIVQLEDSSYMITGTSSSFMNAPSEIFLMKLNKFGVHQWAKHYGGEEADLGRRILNWNDSVFFLAGNTQTTDDNGFDLFLVKVDKNGDVLSEKTIGTPGWDRVNDALITPDSSVLMVGETTNTLNNNSNFYIVKTDHNGDTLWTKNFGTEGFDVLNSVVQLDATTFYAAGASYNADSIMVKGVVLCFNELGVVSWMENYGGFGEYMLNEIYLKNGKIFGVGSRKHPIFGDQDEWQLRINGDGTPDQQDLEQHKTGEVRLVGATLYGDESKAYVVRLFNDEYSANNSFDLEFTRYEYYLDYEWFNPSVPKVTIGFTMDEEFGEIIPTSDGGWVAVGSSPSLEYGGSAVFVLKTGPGDDFPSITWSNSGSLVELMENNSAEEIKVYPNPVNDQLTIRLSSNTWKSLTILDVNGRVLEQKVVLTENTTIETSLWEKGVYYLKLENENGMRRMMKFVVQH